MTTRRPGLLLDTSAAVPLIVADHAAHRDVVAEVADFSLGLAGHAAFETYSVLTRLPAPLRRSASVVSEMMRHNFPATKFLSESETVDLLSQLPELGVAGGSVYDALVGAVASANDLPLLSRDVRAADIYRSLRVDVRLMQ